MAYQTRTRDASRSNQPCRPAARRSGNLSGLVLVVAGLAGPRGGLVLTPEDPSWITAPTRFETGWALSALPVAARLFW